MRLDSESKTGHDFAIHKMRDICQISPYLGNNTVLNNAVNDQFSIKLANTTMSRFLCSAPNILL